MEDVPITMTTSFARDLELESIEFVALAEKLKANTAIGRLRRLAVGDGAAPDHRPRGGPARRIHLFMPVTSKNGIALHVQELGEHGSPVVMLMASSSAASRLVDFHDRAGARRTPPRLDVRPARPRQERAHEDGLRPRHDAGRPRGRHRRRGRAGDARRHSYGAVVALRYALANPRASPSSRSSRRRSLVDLAELDAFLGEAPRPWPMRCPTRCATRSAARAARRPSSSSRCASSRPRLAFADLARATTSPTPTSRCLRARCCRSTARTRAACRWASASRASSSRPVDQLEGGHFLPLEASSALTRAIVDFVDG